MDFRDTNAIEEVKWKCMTLHKKGCTIVSQISDEVLSKTMTVPFMTALNWHIFMASLIKERSFEPAVH